MINLFTLFFLPFVAIGFSGFLIAYLSTRGTPLAAMREGDGALEPIVHESRYTVVFGEPGYARSTSWLGAYRVDDGHRVLIDSFSVFWRT